jgi:hypothetical protein
VSASAVYARRFGRVGLKDPRREREVFTVAKARSEQPAAGDDPFRAWWLLAPGRPLAV